MLNNNLITIIANALLITLGINVFISFLSGIRINRHRGGERQPGVFLRLSVTIGLLLLANFLTIYHGLTLTQLFRGIVGDLSITTLIILLLLLWANLFNQHKAPEFDSNIIEHKVVLDRGFALLVVVLGGILYGSYLGVMHFDLYDRGYFPNLIFMLILGVIEVYLCIKARFYALIWLIALLCFYFKFEVSHNIWDYLFDPVLWLICLFRLFR